LPNRRARRYASDSRVLDRNRRRMVGIRHVDAHAVDQREPVGGLPGVLQERADLGVFPGTRAVGLSDAIRQDIHNIGAVVAGGDFVRGSAVAVLVVEPVGTMQQLAENVGRLVAHVVEAALDDMVAHVPATGQGAVEALAGDRVLMAEAILASDDPVDAAGNVARVVGAVGGHGSKAGVHLRLVLGGAISVVELLVAELELGAEVVGPVAEQLQRVVVGLAGDGVKVAGENDAAWLHVRAVRSGLGLLGTLVGEAGALAVADVPVQLGQGALVFLGQAAAAAAIGARIDADGLERLRNRIHLRLGEISAGDGVGADALDAGNFLIFV